MTSRRPSPCDRSVGCRALTLAACIGLVGSLAHQLPAAPPPKRARPPKFAKSITDVFFPDALQKLVGPRPDGATAPEAPDTAAPAAATAGAVAGPMFAWSKWIALETIEDEIKAQQIKLAESVASPTKFQGGTYRDARMRFSLLAILFAIDAQYDGQVRWQREAPHMRDALARAGFNCKVGTDASYKEARLRADELQSLVRGGSVPMVGAAAESDWNKIADRAPLMKRMEQSQESGLAPWTANAGEFARHAEGLSHEAQLLAALADVIAREGFEFSDDEAYREYAFELRSQSLAVRDAVEQKNYDAARRAVGEIGKACTHCHEGFRN